MPQDITTGLPVKSYEARTFPLSQRFIEDLTGKNLFSYAMAGGGQ